MGLCVSTPADKAATYSVGKEEIGEQQNILAKEASAPIPDATKPAKAAIYEAAAKEAGAQDAGAKRSSLPQGCMACGPAALKLAEAVCPPDELIGNILDPINGPAAGLPYKVHYLGPPAPPCEGDRLATARALGRIDDPSEDPEITNILQLCSSIFSAPVSLCALFDDQRVFISEQDGSVIPRGNFPWRWTLCGWSLAFKNPQILVIPDTHQDARFANNLKVTQPPHVRFYCGAPLVASNGHRLGTLCFADVKPRIFDQASCMIMNNLSELVVRQLEKGIALKAKAKDNNELAATYGQLQRAFDAFEHCVMLLDVTKEDGWKVIYSNAMLEKLTGLERNSVVGKLVQDLFEEGGGHSLISAGLQQAIADNKSYRVRVARVRNTGSGSGGMALTLTFRPAAKEHLDEHVMQIGVPAFLPVKASGDAGAVQQKLYFMTIDQIGHSGSSIGSSSRLSPAGSVAPNAEVEGLEVGHLLGRGTFGSVYYGTWFGSPVAVKVIESDASKTGPLLEAVLSQQMKHPLIVATLKYFHRVLKPPAASSVHDSAAPSSHSGWHESGGGTGRSLLLEAGGSGWNQSKKSQSNDGRDGEISSAHPSGLNAHQSSTNVHQNELNAQQGGVDAQPCGADAHHSGPNSGPHNNSSSNGWAVIDSQAQLERDSVDISSLDKLVQPNATAIPPSLMAGNASMVSTDRGGQREWRQTWLVMEYADRGSLQEALDRGWMYLDRAEVARGPNIVAVLATASEVASALKYLHAQQVVHGDLSGWNIMLCSSGTSAEVGGRGWVAKVGDFGLARSLDVNSQVMTKRYGTLTHQPPEALTQGVISRATDVYSFGVLLWQMYTGSRPWSGLSHAQVIMQVGNQGAKLKWPENTPANLRALGEACMHPDAAMRPTMEEVTRRLENLQAELVGPDGEGPELGTEGQWT